VARPQHRALLAQGISLRNAGIPRSRRALRRARRNGDLHRDRRLVHGELVAASLAVNYERGVIRPAMTAEAEQIARIINAAFEIEREFRRGERTSASAIRDLIERGLVLVAEHDGRLLGAVEVRVAGR